MGTYDHTTPFTPATYEYERRPSARRLTFAQLCRRDPRLAALAAEISHLPRRKRGFCANTAWYGRDGYKRQLIAIIGSLAVQFDPDLRTSAAYDTAYQTLYWRLPDCQHDGMCRA